MYEKKPKKKGCSVPQESHPPLIEDSFKFTVKVNHLTWNCALGNYTNLIKNMGNHDAAIEASFDKAVRENEDPMTNVMDMLKKSGYQIQSLK